MAWQVSPILAPLIAEVKAKNPGMTVFTIGDTAHQAEPSDHNPDQWDYVCAADFMIGSSFTAADAEFLFDRINQVRDSRTAYAIYNRRIESRTVQPWVVRSYSGTDPHTNHVHVSVVHGSNPHPTTSWGIYPEVNMALSGAADENFLQSAILAYHEGGLPTFLGPEGTKNYINYFANLCTEVHAQQATITTLLNLVMQQSGATAQDIAAALAPLIVIPEDTDLTPAQVTEAVKDALRTGVGPH